MKLYASDMAVQVSERVAVRVQRRRAAEAAKQAVLEAQAREQDQFESIKREFGVDTATVRSALLFFPIYSRFWHAPFAEMPLTQMLQ